MNDSSTGWFVGILVACAALLAIGYMVFSANEGSSNDSTSRTSLTRSGGVSFLADLDTGCQYILSNSGDVEPRMRADGKQYCK